MVIEIDSMGRINLSRRAVLAGETDVAAAVARQAQSAGRAAARAAATVVVTVVVAAVTAVAAAAAVAVAAVGTAVAVVVAIAAATAAGRLLAAPMVACATGGRTGRTALPARRGRRLAVAGGVSRSL